MCDLTIRFWGHVDGKKKRRRYPTTQKSKKAIIDYWVAYTPTGRSGIDKKVKVAKDFLTLIGHVTNHAIHLFNSVVPTHPSSPHHSLFTPQ